MDIPIPSADELQRSLARLTTAQLRQLSVYSGVPFTTLWKVRSGETKNPGVETVRQFFPFVERAASVGAPTHQEV